MLLSLVAVVPMQQLCRNPTALARSTKWWSLLLLPNFGVFPEVFGVARKALRTMPSSVTTKQLDVLCLIANFAGLSGTLASWIQF